MRVRSALKRAVRDALREFCNFADTECDITPPPGQPFASAGKWFVAVWDGTRSWEHSGSVMTRLSVNITVSLKINAPHDRIGNKEIDLSEQQEGLNDRVGRICSMLFAQQWVISQYFNNFLGTQFNGMLEAPRPISDGPPEECTAEWFHGEMPAKLWQTPTRKLPAGYRCTINYGNALIAQYIEEGTG